MNRSVIREPKTRVMHRFWLAHTNFAEEFEFLARNWPEFIFHQSNSNCLAKFAKPKSVHYSCSGYFGTDQDAFTNIRR